ncbi:MAG: MOSC domain-containing protein [Candidatus Eisenbacteria bacterium]
MQQGKGRGQVEGIYIIAEQGGPPHPVVEARLVAGAGIEGDRHFARVRTGTGAHRPEDELTLIEAEAIEALARDYGFALGAGESRRNLVTRGIALNDLVGREFRIGAVRARGIRLCEPCAHLAGMTGKEVLRGLIHRGGLRAEILEGGIVHVEDPIDAEEGRAALAPPHAPPA